MMRAAKERSIASSQCLATGGDLFGHRCAMRQAQTRREVEAALEARSVDTYADFLLPFLRPNMTVLDCGCGKETIALGLAQAVPTGWIIGVDLDKGCLATANSGPLSPRRRWMKAGPGHSEEPAFLD